MRGETELFQNPTGAWRVLGWSFVAPRHLRVTLTDEEEDDDEDDDDDDDDEEAAAVSSADAASEDVSGTHADVDAARDRDLGTVTLPSQFYGNFGGARLTFSPCRRFAVLYLYSGQNEEGYELFRVDDRLQHLQSYEFIDAWSGYPVFSPDGRYLVAMSYSRPQSRPREDGACVRVCWANVVVQSLDPFARPELVGIDVHLPADTDQDVEQWTARPGTPRFVSPDAFEVPLPWGKVVTVMVKTQRYVVAPPPDPGWREGP